MSLHEHFERQRETAELGERACKSMGEYADKLVQEIDSELGMEWIRSLFGGKTDFTLNWLFLSVSGVSGSYTTLEDLEDSEEHWEDGRASITACVVQPRMFRIYKGNIAIERGDIEFLTATVQATLDGVARSQEGNVCGASRSST